MTLNDQVVWITGASSGIGEALAYAFAEEGARLILSARRASELERVARNCLKKTAYCRVLTMDLTQSAQIEEAVDTIKETLGRVDFLVNNGGISTRASVEATGIEVDRRVMEVNYFGSVVLTKAVLPMMRQQGKGHIVVISSVAGKFGFYLRSAYSASKHALHGFFEALHLELIDEGIDVTMVCPGRIQTQISVNALTADGTPHGKMDPGQKAGIPADECAQKIIRGVKRKKREVYIGGQEVTLVHIKRLFPGLFFRIVRKLKSKAM